jgi:glycerophosphoryl diester phosphodiesterase
MIIIGHRGAMGHAPENTISSFEKAIALGAKHVELDIVLVENQLVVFHDRRVDDLTEGTGYIEEYSLEDLQKLKVLGEDRIPTLGQVLQIINGRAAVNIELKGRATAVPVAKLIDAAIESTSNWTREQFLISSFRHKELVDFSKESPNIPVGVLIVCEPINPEQLLSAPQTMSLHISIDFVSKELVEAAHKIQKRVFVYTVNHPDDIEKMSELGVDGIFTNYPDRAIDTSYKAEPSWS